MLIVKTGSTYVQSRLVKYTHLPVLKEVIHKSNHTENPEHKCNYEAAPNHWTKRRHTLA